MIFSRTSSVVASSIHRRTDIAVSHVSSPYVQVYGWSSGFGTKYADPPVTPTGTGQGLSFSPSASSITHGSGAVPVYMAFQWTVGTGFGAKYADPPSAPTPANGDRGQTFSPEGEDIVLGLAGVPRIAAYKWESTGWGAKYANPVTLPLSNVIRPDFHPSGTAVAFGQTSGTINLGAYAWTVGTGFGSRYADPVSMGSINGQGAKFNHDGTVVARTTNVQTSASSIDAWAWSSGFGTKYTTPATFPTALAAQISWTTNSSAVAFAVTYTTANMTYVYPWSAGFGTKYANPAGPLDGSILGITFSTDNRHILVGTNGGAYLQAFEWSSSGFGAKLANPSPGITTTQINNIAMTYKKQEKKNVRHTN